jgi:hypothetical protein
VQILKRRWTPTGSVQTSGALAGVEPSTLKITFVVAPGESYPFDELTWTKSR